MPALRLAPPLAALLFALPRSAAADPPTSSSPPPTLMVAGPPPTTAPPATVAVAAPPRVRPPQKPDRWYGWQLLIGYAAADALLATGLGLVYTGVKAGVAPAVIGGIAHAALGPVIHMVRGRHWALLTLAIPVELILPIGGMLSANEIMPRCEPDRKPECYARTGRAIGMGAAIGTVAAGIVEVAVFSVDDASKRGSSSFGVAPLVGRHELGLSVAGSF